MTKHTFTFTPEEVTLIQRAAKRVWDAIAYDMIEACGEMSRANVVEVVCDASRLEQELAAMKADKGLINRVSDANIGIYKIVKPAFRSARYGL